MPAEVPISSTEPVAGGAGGEAVVDERAKDVYKVLLELAKGVSEDKRGALFVVAPPDRLRGVYEAHFPQVVEARSILETGMREVVRKLCTLDGATLLEPDGTLVAYGARIIPQSVIPGFGTRHSAARGVTEAVPGATAVLVSEETGWIKVFQAGRVVLETDGTAVETTFLRRMAEFLVHHDLTLLTTAGVSVATMAGLGMGNPISVLVIGGTYVIVRSAFSTLSSVLGRKDGKRAADGGVGSKTNLH